MQRFWLLDVCVYVRICFDSASLTKQAFTEFCIYSWTRVNNAATYICMR